MLDKKSQCLVVPLTGQDVDDFMCRNDSYSRGIRGDCAAWHQSEIIFQCIVYNLFTCLLLSFIVCHSLFV